MFSVGKPQPLMMHRICMHILFSDIFVALKLSMYVYTDIKS